MQEIGWEEFFEKLGEVEFGDYDLIVAIGQGGIIPGGFIQQKLNIPMKIINLNYRDENNKPVFDEVRVTEEIEFEAKGKDILLVDDVSRTGKTVEKAKELLRDNDITTFVINGDADLNIFNQEECILMPWKKYK